MQYTNNVIQKTNMFLECRWKERSKKKQTNKLKYFVNKANFSFYCDLKKWRCLEPKVTSIVCMTQQVIRVEFVKKQLMKKQLFVGQTEATDLKNRNKKKI